MKKKKAEFRDKESPNHFIINSTTDSPSPPPPPSTAADPVVSSSSSLWSSFVSSAFSIFDSSSSSSSSHSGGGVVVDSSSSAAAAAAAPPPPTAASASNCGKKTEITSSRTSSSRNNSNHVSVAAWRAALKRLIYSSGGGGGGGRGRCSVSAMRRFQERLLGGGGTKTGISSCSTTSDIWFLGVCYHLSISISTSSGAGAEDDDDDDDSINNNNNNNDHAAAFEHDFSSRILMTYRKGFKAIEDSKYTSDVNWGCMLRSSQMLLAQALLFHRLGRSWRKPLHKQQPMDPEYIEILHLFGDTEAAPFSIHNLLQAGKSYGLAAGSWVGPYAMCRSLETLVRTRREESDNDSTYLLPMAVYIVSGDEDGERGGAPVVCIEDASRQCFDFSKAQLNWTPILLLVPLVLGLDKVNPRYIPLLGATFSFPQSLGILGGKPGASTYIVGVQDEKAFYLDPHDVQPAVDISRNNLEADTSSYHCNVIRHIPLEMIDPSLAIGFYCRDKDDFDDFCSRASKLADQSNGAPLFTVAETHKFPKPVNHNDDSTTLREDEEPYDVVPMRNSEGQGNEDDWQLL